DRRGPDLARRVKRKTKGPRQPTERAFALALPSLFTLSASLCLFPIACLKLYRRFMRLRLLPAALIVLSLGVFAQTPQLIPVPREYHAKADVPLPHGVQIVCTNCDAEDQFAANDLRETLSQRGVAIDQAGGFTIRFE